tara:strand:- start:13301 stop:14479 length:1179 start_codon:yes stop_codon:yes gene_type:complete
MIGSLDPRQIFSRRSVRWYAVDWHILLVALVLVAIGLVLQSAMDAAEPLRTAGGVDYAGHKKKVLLTLPLVGLGMCLRPGWLRAHARFLYVLSLMLVAAVWVVGVERNNARRWIPVPGFDLQPSELAKLGLTLMLAAMLAKNRFETLSDTFWPLIALVIPLGMVAAQPDLGTALTLVPITLGLLYLAGASGTRIATLVVTGALVGWTAHSAGLVQDYQLRRVETWAASFDPETLVDEKHGPAYHTYQARVVIGNGSLWGRGLGNGVANEVRHLPERDSDSVFAVVAEEFGWFGAMGLIALYALLPILLLISASRQRDRFSRLVVGGVALYFGCHLVIHIAVNVGMLPMTGLTLPFLSAGGSSLLASFLALGVALGLSAHHERALDADAFRPY